MSAAKRIVLLGAGRVAWHLAQMFAQTEGLCLTHIYARRLGEALSIIKEFSLDSLAVDTLWAVPRDADYYIYALSDSALPEVWEQMPQTSGIWIHTAGSVSLEAMAEYHSASGILYPLQTFSRERSPLWGDIPIYIEATSEAALLATEWLARTLSRRVEFVDSRGRMRLHLAAVFACNFSNHLIALAEEFLDKGGLNPKALLPLLRETFLKLECLPARAAQTGPAARGDNATMQKHLDLLSGEGRMQSVYRLLSESIREVKTNETDNVTVNKISL